MPYTLYNVEHDLPAYPSIRNVSRAMLRDDGAFECTEEEVLAYLADHPSPSWYIVTEWGDCPEADGLPCILSQVSGDEFLYDRKQLSHA